MVARYLVYLAIFLCLGYLACAQDDSLWKITNPSLIVSANPSLNDGLLVPIRYWQHADTLGLEFEIQRGDLFSGPILTETDIRFDLTLYGSDTTPAVFLPQLMSPPGVTMDDNLQVGLDPTEFSFILHAKETSCILTGEAPCRVQIRFGRFYPRNPSDLASLGSIYLAFRGYQLLGSAEAYVALGFNSPQVDTLSAPSFLTAVTELASDSFYNTVQCLIEIIALDGHLVGGDDYKMTLALRKDPNFSPSPPFPVDPDDYMIHSVVSADFQLAISSLETTPAACPVDFHCLVIRLSPKPNSLGLHVTSLYISFILDVPFQSASMIDFEDLKVQVEYQPLRNSQIVYPALAAISTLDNHLGDTPRSRFSRVIVTNNDIYGTDSYVPLTTLTIPLTPPPNANPLIFSLGLPSYQGTRVSSPISTFVGQCTTVSEVVLGTWQKLGPGLLKFTPQTAFSGSPIVFTCPTLLLVPLYAEFSHTIAVVSESIQPSTGAKFFTPLQTFFPSIQTGPNQPNNENYQIVRYSPTAIYIENDKPLTDTVLNLMMTIPDLCVWSAGFRFEISPSVNAVNNGGAWPDSVHPRVQFLTTDNEPVSFFDCVASRLLVDCTLLLSNPCSFLKINQPLPRAHDDSTSTWFRLSLTFHSPIQVSGAADHLVYTFFTHPADPTAKGLHKIYLPPDDAELCLDLNNPNGPSSNAIFPANSNWLTNEGTLAASIQNHFDVSFLSCPNHPPIQFANPTFALVDNDYRNPNLNALGLVASNWNYCLVTNNDARFTVASGSEWTECQTPDTSPVTSVSPDQTTFLFSAILDDQYGSVPSDAMSYRISPVPTTGGWHCSGSGDHSCVLALPSKPIRHDFVLHSSSLSSSPSLEDDLHLITFLRASMWIGNNRVPRFTPTPTITSPDLLSLFSTTKIHRLDHIIFDFGFAPALIRPAFLSDPGSVSVVIGVKNGVSFALTGPEEGIDGPTGLFSNLMCMWELRQVTNGDYNNGTVLEQQRAKSPSTFTPSFSRSGPQSHSQTQDPNDVHYDRSTDRVLGVYQLPAFTNTAKDRNPAKSTDTDADVPPVLMPTVRLVCFFLPVDKIDLTLTPKPQYSLSVEENGTVFSVPFTQPFTFAPGPQEPTFSPITLGSLRPVMDDMTLSMSVGFAREFVLTPQSLQVEIEMILKSTPWVDDQLSFKMTIPEWYSIPATATCTYGAFNFVSTIDTQLLGDTMTLIWTFVWPVSEPQSETPFLCPFTFSTLPGFTPLPQHATPVYISAVAQYIPLRTTFTGERALSASFQNNCRPLSWPLTHAFPIAAVGQSFSTPTSCQPFFLSFTFQSQPPIDLVFSPTPPPAGTPAPTPPQFPPQSLYAFTARSVSPDFTHYQLDLYSESSSGSGEDIFVTRVRGLSLLELDLNLRALLAVPSTRSFQNLYIKATFTGTDAVTPVTFKTSTFGILSACAANPCTLPGEVCHPQLGVCYTPSTNPSSPSLSQCPWCFAANTQSCGTTDEKPCLCKSGWDGLTCQQDTQCQKSKSTCIPSNSFIDVVNGKCAQTCSCIGSWTGSRCERCPLECKNSGKAYPDCNRCGCARGFSGDRCECRAKTGFVTISATNPVITATLGRLASSQTTTLMLGHNGLIDIELIATPNDAALFEIVSDVLADIRQPFSGAEDGPVDLTIAPGGKPFTTIFTITTYYGCEELSPIDSDGEMAFRWKTGTETFFTFPSIQKHFPLLDKDGVSESDLEEIEETIPHTDPKTPLAASATRTIFILFFAIACSMALMF